MGNSLNILNTCLPQQPQQNQNDNASDENVAPTPPLESSKSRPGLQLGKKPAKSASTTPTTTSNNSSSASSSTFPTAPNASTSTSNTATTWEEMDDNWNEEAKDQEVVDSSPAVDSSSPSTSNPTNSNSSTSAKANDSANSAPPLSKSNSASIQQTPEPDFFSDMQPVYKAPKKIASLEKKEAEEKSDRLSRIAMDSSIVNDEKGGWDNDEELLADSPNNSVDPSSNENGNGTETGNGNNDINEKQDRKQKPATAKKETKPKLQAVKVSGSKPNFDDSEEEQAVTQ